MAAFACSAVSGGRHSIPVISHGSPGRLVQAMCLYKPVLPAALSGLVRAPLISRGAVHSKHLALGPPFFWADSRHPAAMMPLRLRCPAWCPCVPLGFASAWGGLHGMVGEMPGGAAPPGVACVGACVVCCVSRWSGGWRSGMSVAAVAWLAVKSRESWSCWGPQKAVGEGNSESWDS